MGLSSKQVSSDHGLDWSHTLLQAQVLEPPKPEPAPAARRQQQQQQQQPNQQQSEALKCPRCESTNTKFCYYNNYNKSQPRHFCKACKRHWTKGGTLRNVPVGGGRKNKRLKASKTTTKDTAAASTCSGTTAAATTASTSTSNGSMIINRISPHMAVHSQVPDGNQKRVSEALYQALIGSSTPSLNPNNSNGVFLSSSDFSLPNNQVLSFPYSSINSSSSCFDTLPCSVPTSVQSSSFYNYTCTEGMEDSTITTVMPKSSSSNGPVVMPDQQQPWQVTNNASCGNMDMTSYWNWEEIGTLVSTTDLNIAWDDSEIKP